MKCIQLALFLLVGISTTDASNKTQQILKKIGKRFSLSEYGTVQRLEFWWKTPEEVDAARNHSAQLVALHLLRQSSNHNYKFQESADILLSLMDAQFAGRICNGKDSLNYYQMAEYFKRQRGNYRRNSEEKVSWSPVPTESINDNIFLVSFMAHSTWEYSSKISYLVKMELLGEKPYSNYTLTRIEEVGACTEYGVTNLENTDIFLDLHETDPERVDTRKKVFKHFYELFTMDREESVIPFNWLSYTGVSADLDIQVCHGSELKKIGKYNFIDWWLWFQKMYHPVEGDKQHTRVQVTGGEYDRFVFRVTMRVQIGTELNAPIEIFNFKIQNVYGDKEWNIDKFEVMCPVVAVPEIDLMKKHASAFKEIIGGRIQKMVNAPEMWYTAVDALATLTSRKFEIENCAGLNGEAMEKANNFADLKHKFWELNKSTNGRMEGFDLGRSRDISSVKDKMWVQIYIIWTPERDTLVHESKWTFELEWNRDIQAFSIYKMKLGCPKTGKGSRNFNSLRHI